MLAKQKADYVTLIASAARTAATGAGTATYLPGMVNGFVFELDLTAAATEVGDLLDVYVQTTVDGTNYVDVALFTQCLGNGGAKRYYMKITADGAMTGFENGTAVGANAIRDILGDVWKVRWAITDAGADNASFTFSVTAIPM